MTDEDEIPTLGAYVPVPPGGPARAGGEARGSWKGARAPSGDDAQGSNHPERPAAREVEKALDVEPLDSLDVEVPSETLEAQSAATGGSKSGTSGTSGAASTGGSVPPTMPMGPEPGLHFLSTTGDPDTYEPPTVAAGDDEQPTRISDRFEVIRLLGKGGMGRVYRVRDRHIQGRELALKILHRRFSESPYFKELFFREIKTAQEFVSEHVNQVRDTGITDDGQIFLTMDLVDGETLRSVLRREQTLGVRHALEIVRQALIGLQSGHEQGFIHRDVKPENLMLVSKVAKTDSNPFGVGVRLLDFGLAGLAAELEEGGTHGTPMYMSPEQAQGKRLDPRSDLFSIGTVLYEMLVGSRPFHGKTVANVLTSVIETDVHPLIDQMGHVDKRVRKMLRKALAKKREDRFQSASEFITAIEKAPAFRPPTEMPLWGTAAILVLAAGTVAGGTLWRMREGRIEAVQGRYDAAQAQIVVLQGEVSTRDGEIQALQGKLVDAQQAASLKGDEVVSSKVDTEAIERMQADWQAKLDLQEAMLMQVQSQQARDKEAADKKIRDLEQTAAKQADDLKKLQRLEAQTKPIPTLAKGIDSIVRLAEGGFLDQVEGYVTILALSDVLKGYPFNGKEYLQALGSLCTAVHFFESSVGDDALQQKFLAEGEQAMKALRGTRAQFAITAAEYLDEPLEENPNPTRLARLDAITATLDERLASMRQSAAVGTESAWESFLVAGADQDPGPVFDLAAQTGAWENVRAILEAYAKDLEQRAVHSGVLDVEVLRADDWLATWVERLAKQPQVRDWSSTKDVRLFAFARAWYYGEDPRPLTSAELDLKSAPLTSPRADWRWETHLKAQLTSDRGAWPLGPTKEAVYLKSSPTGNQWIKDRGDRREGSSWIVSRSIYRERADKIEHLSTSEFAYDLHGGRTFGWTSGSIDTLADAARVARFEPMQKGDVPSKLGVTADDVAAYRARLDASSADERACLVFVSGKTTRWISPVLGLVREEQETAEGQVVTELVYTNVVK